MAALKVESGLGPPFRARKGVPERVKLTVKTLPAGWWWVSCPACKRGMMEC
jgi:hypothetical protein